MVNLSWSLVRQKSESHIRSHTYTPEMYMDWILDFLDPDSGCVREDPDSGFLNNNQIRAGIGFEDRCQAKFLTCYCFSVILLLRIKKGSLEITFLMCVV